MQCRVEERTIRRIEVVEVKCFKCKEKGHKCKECLLWMKERKATCVARSQKAQQGKKLACPVKGKVQERRLRRAEEREMVYVTEP